MPHARHLLVTGFGWHEGRPQLRVRADAGRGKTLDWTFPGALRVGVGERRCTGYREGRQPKPCPDAATATGKQCPACMARDTFRPCMICDGFACPRLVPSAREACLQTHHLYLASFGGPEVKVGTASDPRKTARLVDQGPLYAVRVARGPGPRIKQLEHVASTQTTAVEGARRSRKLALLRGGMRTEEAAERVLSVLSDVRAVAGADYDDLFQLPEVVRMPTLARETREAVRGEPELPVEEGARIEVRVVGAVGHTALVEEPAGRFLLDLGELVGRLVDPDPPASTPRSRVQLGLFG
ncbi:MAG: DUF2797 domain-containing protein [Alphaproteobacteria bacterium]|nr:DUF2797 domain-containing protein [Alphaproteobacteria bacterium]